MGIVRILVFWMLARKVSSVPVGKLLEIPAVFRDLPPGWGWIGRILPLFDPAFAETAQTVVTVAACLACVGLATRVAAPVAALGAVYVLCLPHCFFKINHAGHALVWCALIVSTGPSNRALSLDAALWNFRQGRYCVSTSVPPSIAYALPIRLCWLSFGVAYFFPGLFKAFEAGDLWLNGQAISSKMVAALAKRPDFSPLLPLYESPTLSSAAGAGTLLFELGFILLLFSRRWWLAPVFGAMFHLGVKALMGISFLSMLALYFVFIDFEAILTRVFRANVRVCRQLGLAESPTTAGSDLRGSIGEARYAPTVVFGGLLVVANLYAGAARINSWPISVFPLFAGRGLVQPTSSSRVELALLKPSGREVELKPEKFRRYLRGPRWSYLTRDLSRAKGKDRVARARGVARLARRVGYRIGEGDRLLIYRASYRIAAGERPKLIRRKVLGRVRLGSFGK